MDITYGELYENSEKNLKKRYEEQKTLEMIKNHIKRSNNFQELRENPLSNMYGYEPLKYELNGYYSFNLCKNGGTIRLIISVNESLNQVCLEYVDPKHYKEFKNKIKRK